MSDPADDFSDYLDELTPVTQAAAEEKPAASAHRPVDPAQAALVEKISQQLAHAWMVRTFVKHSTEVEDFPELMNVVRAVFDSCRAIEPHRDNPGMYLRTVRKKWTKLRQASEQFAIDAPIASDHTNFKQAVISLATCLTEIERLLNSESSS